MPLTQFSALLILYDRKYAEGSILPYSKAKFYASALNIKMPNALILKMYLQTLDSFELQVSLDKQMDPDEMGKSLHNVRLGRSLDIHSILNSQNKTRESVYSTNFDPIEASRV